MGNKVEEKKHALPQPPETARAELILVAYCKRTVIMDFFMSDVEKKLKQS